MDFEDTPEEAAFRDEARTWLDANAKPLQGRVVGAQAAARMEPDSVARSQAWQARKADAGWACITWPSEYGGRDATPIQNVIWKQEEARYDVPPNVFTIGQGMLGPTLMAHGTDEQKTLYLEKMLRGEEIWSQLFSEPGAGSDLAGLRTSSVRDGNDWILNGQKIWTSGAHYSKWGMVITRSDPNVAKHSGLTYFIVDLAAHGIEIRPIRQMNRATNFNEVFLNDVRVPDRNRVGAVGDGWRGALTTLMNERAAIGGGGAGGPGFADLLRLASDVEAGGAPAIESSRVREVLADFYTRTKGVEYTSYRALTALSRGTTPGPQSSLGKLVGAALRQRMAGFAMELMGQSGLGRDDDDARAWQLAYLSAPGGRLAGGTDEILRNIIAERVLELPPEVRADKGMSFGDIPTGPPGKG